MSNQISNKSVEFSKTIWQQKHRQLWCFFCPLCKCPRKLPMKPKPGSAFHFFQIGLTSLVFTLVLWNWLGWKGGISFFPFWVTFELVYRWRVRTLLQCRQCGFDPYLFLIDEDLAKKEIKAHWKNKFLEKGIPIPDPPSPHHSM